MKRYIISILTILTLLCSCNEDISIRVAGTNELLVNVSVAGLETRSTEAGENTLNENKIVTLDVFLYRNESGNADVVKKLTINADEQATGLIKLTESELTSLGYTSGIATSFKVFVIANLPGDVSLPTTKSIENLKDVSLVVNNFNEKQNSFVMTGEATATGGAGLSGFTVSVDLKRVACKFAIDVQSSASDVVAEIDGVAGQWNPVTDAVSVKFYGVVKNGKVGGTPQRYTVVNFEDPRSVPTVYYSYPPKPLPENKPYYIVKIPWQKVGDGTVKDTYYKIICDYDEFVSNTFYKLLVDVNLVGSSTEPEAVTIEPEALTYTTEDWKEGTANAADYNTEAVIREARFLILNKEQYDMENIDAIDIPYTSSHPCTIELSTKKWTDFSGTTAQEKNLDVYGGNKTVIIDSYGDYFKLTHTLNNDFLNTTNYDVCPFVFTVKIYHTDDEEHYSRMLTITQKPAITIEVDPNSQGGTNTNRFINGSTSTNNINANLGGIYSVGEQTTNIFIFTVSALPEGSPYIIGDPREDNPVPWDNTDFFGGSRPTLANGRDIRSSTTRNTLQNYFPTREDNSSENVIAPKFCTSSAWSRCSSYNNTRAVLHRRAAVYQEKGRPAGRWRFLTQAEAAFLAKLNQHGKIPQLFSTTNRFLVAGGYINNGVVNKNTTQNGSVRLCYDEWYWNNTDYSRCGLTTFTWGDMPR